LPDKKVAPYGSWRSPITSETLTKGMVFATELTTDGTGAYWLELHPERGGHYLLYGLRDGKIRELATDPYDVRTRVHEYGGGSYLVDGDDVFFSNFKDQLVYRLHRGGDPVPISKPGHRFADCAADLRRRRIIGVCEDHTQDSRLPENSIAGLGFDGSGSETLVSGNDFYSSPRIDPTGTKVAWVTWNFPQMPWDGTELWVGELGANGSIVDRRLVAGSKTESVVMPQWSPGGVLHFVSDRTGFWNIYRWTGGKGRRLTNMEADMARPQWAFRNSSYDFLSEEEVVFTFCKDGLWHLAVLNPETKLTRKLRTSYVDIGYVRALKGRLYFIGGSASEPLSVVRMDISDGSVEIVRRPGRTQFKGFVSKPRHVRFRTGGRKQACGLLYMPANKNQKGPAGTKPPLIIEIHGGPTSQARVFRNLGIQYWTSRGFAVLDVNYGGSSGYGRDYRERLRGNWGVVDVEDCVNGALAMAHKGLVDGKELIIRGGSAGGYTTLCALASGKVFGAGASYFGVSDAEALTKETHKFEARYLDSLIAPYPEGKSVYQERSPVHFVDRITAPVIFFQGLEDVIVPPSQAETMVESLRKSGVPVAYIPFEGEQHGFRRAESIRRSQEAELYFYSKVFGFEVPERIEPVEIANLERR
jgi:dipeptidyl aminopeptidase/acylaminoacyl peptidase